MSGNLAPRSIANKLTCDWEDRDIEGETAINSAVEAIEALIIEALEDVECCKHGYGDACPHIRQQIAELKKLGEQ